MKIRTLHSMQKETGARLAIPHKWYAWHPVVVGDQWVWLEYVTRRAGLWGDGTLMKYFYSPFKE